MDSYIEYLKRKCEEVNMKEQGLSLVDKLKPYAELYNYMLFIAENKLIDDEYREPYH